ncbi:MAG TPA: sigma-70 family RNA polymerase sigma factor [Candidatus Acidoferrum sp.]
MCAQSSSNTPGMDDAAPGASKPVRLLAPHRDLVDLLFTEVSASPWSVTRDRFESALERSAAKRFGTAHTVPRAQLEEYLGALHLQDLSLAAACASGHTAAWEFFVITYRGYLRAASAAILRCSAASPAAQDLADSLFTDLYGISPAEKSEDRSLFRYFHGRSSLKTWLRAVLAQRHIDSIRSSRRFIDLDESDSDDAESQCVTRIDSIATASNPARDSSPDPHRSRYLALFAAALDHALNALDRQDKLRLRLYYVDQQTLAQIGRDFGEHESSVSRHLDRIRRELRVVVEATLRAGQLGSPNGTQPQPALSDAQISLCFEYAAEDAPINFDKLFPGSGTTPGQSERLDP